MYIKREINKEQRVYVYVKRENENQETNIL